VTNIAFVDCETTHLDAEIGEAWEVAVILREQDGGRTTDTEYVWQFAVDRTNADPEALRIGRFRERHLVDPTWGAAWTGPGPIIPLSRESAINAIVHVLSGAVIVGSNPGFDDRFLRKLLGPGGAQWHYRPYDIVQLAAAKIGAQQAGPLPWRSHVLSRAVGVEPPTEDVAHTALGDARWARDVHDAVMIREKFPLSWEGRAQHAIGLYTETAIELEDARRALAAATDALARARGLASRWAVLRTHGSAATELRTALDGPSTPVTFQTERAHWVNIADALNAAHAAGMPVGIDLDGTLTDHNAWSVVWDHDTERWTVAGYDADEDQDDGEPEEFEETGDADGDVFELISEIAGRLSDATDEGEYHAVGLISDLANGRKRIAEARAELAEITFRHV